MTLTDRQQKFYEKIVELSDESSSASPKEKKYLSRTKNEIEQGVRFQDSINALNFSLQALYKKRQNRSNSAGLGGPSLDVKELMEELIEAYGKPDYRLLNGLGKISFISGTSEQIDAQILGLGTQPEGKSKQSLIGWIVFIVVLGGLLYITWVNLRIFR